MAALLTLVSSPAQMAALVHDGLRELGNAACNELAHGQYLAFTSRLRQVEELHLRTLYLLLLADPAMQYHVLSGEMPNGMTLYYQEVDRVIFEGRGDWQVKRDGLNSDTFTVFDTLHDGAHVSYNALLMARGIAKDPESIITVERYAQHVQNHLAKWRYIHGMFEAGKSRSDVLDGVRSLYRPASYWEEEARKARKQQNGGNDGAVESAER